MDAVLKTLLAAWAAIRSQRIAVNMLCCAFLLWPWGTLRRETISGFFGRRAAQGSRIASIVARGIDLLHPHEPDHCAVTARMEADARTSLEYE